jgi:16S rRNA (cytosine1402-N4)-methyltransferase
MKDDKKTNLYHTSVLLQESIDVLNINPNGYYLDATFGGGGHSAEILKRLDNGKLIAFDQDKDAVQNIPQNENLIFVGENFKYASRFARLHNCLPLDGVLADLGVSSHQFDTADRGFSIRFDGDLDMRMDTRQPFTAAHVINNYDEERLHKLFELYGQVTNAKTLARKISQERKTASLKTTQDLVRMITPIIRGKQNTYLAKVFQAIRIEVNDELGVIKELLRGVIPQLAVGGRVCIITFHSLEDQAVKEVFREFAEEEMTPEEKLLGRKISKNENAFKLKVFKPIKPKTIELKENNRSRSAKIRYAERIN